METITNISDLCEFFVAESPRFLNKRVNDSIKYGASISIHVGTSRRVSNTYSLIFKEGDGYLILDSARKNGQYCSLNGIHVDIRHLFHLRWSEGHKLECMAFPSLEKLVSDCKSFMERQEYLDKSFDFIEIQSINGNCITLRHVHLHEDSRWLSPGEKWPVNRRTNLLGFMIQTQVNGSEVVVSSEEFVVPVDEGKVVEWIEEMENRVDFYWKRDNLDHWRLIDPEGREYFFETDGWSSPQWHEEERVIPDTVKGRVIDWIDRRFGDSICEINKCDEFSFGCKGWTVSQYQDDSEYQ